MKAIPVFFTLVCAVVSSATNSSDPENAVEVVQSPPKCYEFRPRPPGFRCKDVMETFLASLTPERSYKISRTWLPMPGFYIKGA